MTGLKFIPDVVLELTLSTNPERFISVLIFRKLKLRVAKSTSNYMASKIRDRNRILVHQIPKWELSTMTPYLTLSGALGKSQHKFQYCLIALCMTSLENVAQFRKISCIYNMQLAIWFIILKSVFKLSNHSVSKFAKFDHRKYLMYLSKK